jgi:hypothetical protein
VILILCSAACSKSDCGDRSHALTAFTSYPGPRSLSWSPRKKQTSVCFDRNSPLLPTMHLPMSADPFFRARRVGKSAILLFAIDSPGRDLGLEDMRVFIDAQGIAASFLRVERPTDSNFLALTVKDTAGNCSSTDDRRDTFWLCLRLVC